MYYINLFRRLENIESDVLIFLIKHHFNFNIIKINNVNYIYK